MLTRLLLLSLVLFLPSVAQAATYWDDEMETGNTGYAALYDWGLCGGVLAFTNDTVNKYSGAGSLKETFVQPRQTCEGFGDRTFTSTTDLWIRLYIRLSPDWQTDYIGTKLVRQDATDTTYSDWWVMKWGGTNVSVELQNYPLGDTIQLNPNVGQVGAGTLSLGTWTCLEMHTRRNTPGQSNGLVEAWKENEQFMSHTGLSQFANVSFNSLRMVRQDGTGSINYDRIAVGDTRIGCIGSPPAGDTTPPGVVGTPTSPSKTATSINLAWNAVADNTGGSGMGTYRILECTGASCTNHALVATVTHPTVTYSRTGRTASTTYSYKIQAVDNAGNQSAASGALEVTTNAATTLPSITSFTTSGSGGTVVWSTSPATAYVNIRFGGAVPINTEYPIASLPGGVLTFQWPASTTWACAYARDAAHTQNDVDYRCNTVTPVSVGGGGLLRVLTSNPRWLTKDGTTALYLTGISGGTNCNAAFCGIVDIMRGTYERLTTSQTFTAAFTGTSTDLGTTWDAGYTGYQRLDVNTNVVRPSTVGNDNTETYSGTLAYDQYAQITVGTFNDVGNAKVTLLLNFAAPPTDSGYYCDAIWNHGSGYTSRIARSIAGAYTQLVTESATTWATNDILKCTKVANTITLYRNGSVLLTATDATFRSGRVGLSLRATTAVTNVTADNFVTGNMVHDYNASLDLIAGGGANFTRYWAMEQSSWGDASQFTDNTHLRIPLDQFPWRLANTRVDTSTGTSIQVGIYDLQNFHQPFFDRLKARVQAAIAKGITPSVMLFSGGHVAYTFYTYAGFSHPFHANNNTQGIAADTNTSGRVEETHTLANETVTLYQIAYVKKVIDTLNDIEGFVYEITNEDQGDTSAWQNRIMDEMATYQATKPNQHLVWQSAYNFAAPANNNYLFNNARPQIVSPTCTSGGDDYDTNPPYSTGTKVVFNDSDHQVFGCGTEVRAWPWKNFTRGLYTVFLGENESAGVVTDIKAAMAQTLAYSVKINLAAMAPVNGTAIIATGYGLYNACQEYLMYQPSAATNAIDISSCGAGTSFTVEYLNPVTGVYTTDSNVTGAASRNFTSAGERVVYLKNTGITVDTVPPILSGGFPSGTLASGTTSTTMSVITNKLAKCKYDPTDGVAYASMATLYTSDSVFGVNHTTTVAGLADSTAYLRNTKCINEAGYATTVDYPIAWNVAAAPGDTERPSTVTNPKGTVGPGGTSIVWQWDTATDNNTVVGYLADFSQDETFGTVAQSAFTATTTFTLNGTAPGQTWTGRFKAVDQAGNASLDWSPQTVPILTTPPGTVTGLSVYAAYSQSHILTWTPDATYTNSLTITFERCTGAACTNFATVGSSQGILFLDSGLTASTLYRYRAKFTHVLAGTSTDFSSIFNVTTLAISSGITQPRTRIYIERLPRN